MSFSTFLLLLAAFSTSTTTQNDIKQRVAVVGGGISGLVVGHVLQQSGKASVELLEASDTVGGHIRQLADPFNDTSRLNIGHATHMGMFWNLRLLLRYLNEPEWPVGRGSNEQPGLFRMISVSNQGEKYQPRLADITSPIIWWEALVFYYYSHMEPCRRLDDLLQHVHFSDRFQNILIWAMATFEFDKDWQDDIRNYALGTCRALLVTQIFFKFLLCDCFNGLLPPKLNQGLQQDLLSRVQKAAPAGIEQSRLIQVANELGKDPLASYYTAAYSRAMQKLAQGTGNVHTGTKVTRIELNGTEIVVETQTGERISVNAVVLAIQPSTMVDILDPTDFSEHVSALQQVESGAVGVQIAHAKDLPWSYPPRDDVLQEPTVDSKDQSTILGIFDISQLTTTSTGDPKESQDGMSAGWLSIAYPVYSDRENRHEQWLQQTVSSSADKTVYPWTRAVASFPAARQRLVQLQGHKGLYVAGHTLTGVNKASELQVANALKLCHGHFGATPPWGVFFPTPLLPDCNDEDAFHVCTCPFEAIRLAIKNLVGSFLLVGVVSRLGVQIFE